MINDNRVSALKLTAEQIRRRLVEVVYNAKAGHIGGGLSSVNVLTALYFDVMNVDPKKPAMPQRDRFVMSKGHCVEALYSVLEAKGFLTKEEVDTYGTYNTKLAGHPTKKVTGVEINSGALGHGLSVGVGLAIAAKMDKAPFRTFVLMGDGEQGEGSIYEAAMSASHYKLDNLVAIIDRNGLQISDTTENVMALEPIRDRWEAFGWDVIDTNGDDMQSLLEAFETVDYADGKPTLIISHTTKGHGVKLMENVLKWHHGVPSAEEYEQALADIDAELNRLSK